MTGFLFDPAPQPVIPIAGQSALFPVHRIFCVGRNYADHAAEMGDTVDREQAWFFTKSPHHLVVDPKSLAIPAATQNYQHEVEMAVALGDGGFALSNDRALACVMGHALALDMTRRDLQAASKEKRRPWDTGKDVEGSAVFSRIIAGLSPSPEDRLSLCVNGTLRQDGPIGDMVWSVADVISQLSHLYTLRAGDMIMTGTPAGVGAVVAGDRLTASFAEHANLDITFT